MTNVFVKLGLYTQNSIVQMSQLQKIVMNVYIGMDGQRWLPRQKENTSRSLRVKIDMKR